MVQCNSITIATVDDLEHPLNTPFQCGMIGEAGCWDIIAIWSVGVAGFCHNEKAGFKIGASGYKYASMQVSLLYFFVSYTVQISSDITSYRVYLDVF